MTVAQFREGEEMAKAPAGSIMKWLLVPKKLDEAARLSGQVRSAP